MQTPTARIIASALSTLICVDGEGRELVLRRMSALDRLRLFKAVGPMLTQNSAYLGMAALAASVISIDGVPVPTPTTEGQIESLVGRLGDAGISAVAQALTPNAEAEPADLSAGN